MIPSGPIWPSSVESSPLATGQPFKDRLPIYDRNPVKLKARLDRSLDKDQNRLLFSNMLHTVVIRHTIKARVCSQNNCAMG